MYMVGGGSGRVQRGPGRYPGETRWMHPEPPKERRKRVSWWNVYEAFCAVLGFAALISSLNVLYLLLS